MGNFIEVNGDLVNGMKTDVFCHQCNCFGKMGAGIAKQIASVYPEVKDADIANFRKNGAYKQLGTILPVKCEDGRICVNMYSQFHYGRGLQTNYEKFEDCLRKLAWYLKDYPQKTVGFPYGIGCGLAGGNWNIVEKMLRDFAEKVQNDVYVVRYTK